MTEIVTRTDESAPQLDLIWQRRLDALIRGECSEEDFLDELSNCRLLGADSAWSVVALLDQRYRRGQMPVELFRSIESKIAQRELGALDYGTTIELGGVDIDIDIDLKAPDPAIQLAARAAATATAAAATTSAAAAAVVVAAERPAPAPRAKPTGVKVRKEADPSPTADVGRVLRDRYVLEGRLGSGGMGAVFKALDRFRCDLPQADRRVAIKILHEKAVGRPEILANLRREFYCAQALSHPNIIKVYELDRDGDVEFFSMELLEGELLSSVLEHLDPLSMSRSRAWAIILEVAAGLAHAHARNVVHADLKPQNIMLTKRGDIRILDFGASSAIVRRPWSAETAQRSAVTPAYASCELLEGQRADPRDDLFALACVAYELLAGQHPFQRRRSTEARDLGIVIPRPRGLTRRQWRTLSMGLAWHREDRSISVHDWIARLHPGPQPKRLRLATRGIALAALFAALATSVLFNRHLFHGNVAGHAAVPTAAVSQSADPDLPSPGTAEETAAGTEPAASQEPASAAAEPTASEQPAAAGAAAPRQPAASTEPVTAPQPESAAAPPPQSARSAAPGAALVKAHTDTIGLASRSYRVGVHKNFAEIHVRRAFASGSDTSFTWWTEPSSALPDTDYVAQARTVQLLSKQNQMATLFVKLVPNASRKHWAVFYVVIGEPSDGTSLGRVTRAAIVLPAQ